MAIFLLFKNSRYPIKPLLKEAILLSVILIYFKFLFGYLYSETLKIWGKYCNKIIISLLENLSLKDRTALEFIEATFWYIMSAREDATPETLKEIVEKAISKEAGGVIMTVAEKLRQEGRKEGILEAIKMGLEIKFGIMGLSLLPRIEREEDIAKLDMIKDLAFFISPLMAAVGGAIQIGDIDGAVEETRLVLDELVRKSPTKSTRMDIGDDGLSRFLGLFEMLDEDYDDAGLSLCYVGISNHVGDPLNQSDVIAHCTILLNALQRIGAKTRSNYTH